MKISRLIILSVLLLVGCKEEFLLSFSSDQKTLVIEGGITDKPGPYSIRLSTTLPVNQPLRVPYEDCVVVVSDKSGYSETLNEVEPGVYKTSESGIRGNIGNEYSISVKTPEGNEYQTAFQEMRAPIDIDSVYAELTEQENLDYPFGLPGYQFYTDTKTASGDTYILWNMIESYQYNADYKLYALYYYGDMFFTDRNATDIAAITGLNYDTLYTCWKTDAVKNIYTAKTDNLTVPKIKRQPLHFVSTETKKLTVRYGLLLQQYSISKEAYYFWKGIQDQISDESFLYTKQPYNVAGNLKNKKDPGELTLGFFTVASVAEKRVFLDRPNATFYYETGYTAEPIDLNKKPQPVYLISTEQGMAFVHKDCVDCRTEGGVTYKPDFWIDF